MANQSVEQFRRLTKNLQKECVDEAQQELAKQAERLVQRMKSACPVNADPPPQPGLLRDSINWTFGTPPRTRASGAFRAKGSGDFAATVYAGSNKAFYARWVEFGTNPHSLRKGADISRSKRQSGTQQHPGSVAQPFFWPSYRALKGSMRTAVKAKLRAAVQKRSAE